MQGAMGGAGGAPAGASPEAAPPEPQPSAQRRSHRFPIVFGAHGVHSGSGQLFPEDALPTPHLLASSPPPGTWPVSPAPVQAAARPRGPGGHGGSFTLFLDKGGPCGTCPAGFKEWPPGTHPQLQGTLGPGRGGARGRRPPGGIRPGLCWTLLSPLGEKSVALLGPTKGRGQGHDAHTPGAAAVSHGAGGARLLLPSQQISSQLVRPGKRTPWEQPPGDGRAHTRLPTPRGPWRAERWQVPVPLEKRTREERSLSLPLRHTHSASLGGPQLPRSSSRVNPRGDGAVNLLGVSDSLLINGKGSLLGLERLKSKSEAEEMQKELK